jgi:NAD(P)-dependent dehydrogenase (short-subunit alcohol dehydrogenase family)
MSLPTNDSLKDKRVLVVGASKGIGKVIARHLASEGARLALAARSKDLLADVVARCANGAIAVQCDVRDPSGCESVVQRTVETFGGLDALVYCTGVYPFRKIEDADASAWAEVLETNLVGAALVTRAALPHLRSTGGNAIYLSSNSASYAPPWRGIGLYITSKTALEKLIRCLEVENPEIAFTTHIVGPTTADPVPDQPTPELTFDEVPGGDFIADWFAKGYLSQSMTTPEDHAHAVASVLMSRARIQTVMVVPR